MHTKKELDNKISEEVNYVYDLSQEYPIRVQIYELIKNKKENYISIIIHHVALDGWSVEIFLKELEVYYKYHLDRSKGLLVQLNLAKLSIQYKDFAIWQRNYLKGERLDEQLNYWYNKLNGYENLNLIRDRARTNQVDYKGKDIYFELDKKTSVSLRKLAKELKVSLFSLLLAGYYLLLRSYMIR